MGIFIGGAVVIGSLMRSGPLGGPAVHGTPAASAAAEPADGSDAEATDPVTTPE
jgi:hypothetical protein